jgi:hypothetical protein
MRTLAESKRRRCDAAAVRENKRLAQDGGVGGDAQAAQEASAAQMPPAPLPIPALTAAAAPQTSFDDYATLILTAPPALQLQLLSALMASGPH